MDEIARGVGGVTAAKQIIATSPVPEVPTGTKGAADAHRFIATNPDMGAVATALPYHDEHGQGVLRAYLSRKGWTAV